jgi:hypothetical protein
VLAPIEPIDVSKAIPIGTTTITVELRDFGVIAGSTDLFLVTTATIIRPPHPNIEAAWCCGNFECKKKDPKDDTKCVSYEGTNCQPSDTTVDQRKLCNLGAISPAGAGSWMNCSGEQFKPDGKVQNCQPQ